MYTYRMDITHVVILVATFSFLVVACIWAICRLLGDIDSARAQIKLDGQRYERLYTAYVEACNSNPNRPRITTVTQQQRNMPLTMSQGDYLRYEAQELQLRAASASVPQQQPPQSEQKT